MLNLIKPFVIGTIICMLYSCNDSGKKTNNHDNRVLAQSLDFDRSIPGSFHPQTDLTFDSTSIQLFFTKYPDFKKFEHKFISFYRNRDYSYAWFNQDGLIEPAGNLYNRIMNIHEEGLNEKLPYRDSLVTLMEDEQETSSPSTILELMLTAQYFSYAQAVWRGVSEKESISLEWLLPRKQVSMVDLLDSLVSGKQLLDSAPVYRQYGLLQGHLKKYQQLRQQGGWPVISSEKKPLKLGDSSLSIQSIKKYFFLVGDLNENNGSIHFDVDLENAVKLFQQRLGIKETGIINQSLINDMNVPVDKRIEQIIVNMERCRWVPVALNTDYLVVNIPEFRLHVYESDSLMFSMSVVVGKAQHKTVVFNAEMKYVVFSPYWNVPNSILKNEILPAIRRNPNYLAKHNMEWYGNMVRQKPGPNNSLGLVKFLFPNRFNIYLHDTPAKSLFNEDTRAFSHGCIRLSDARKLAIYMLRHDTSWNENNIVAAMNSGVEKTVTLKKTVPVFIAYFTSWVDRRGKLNFRKDIYKRDESLVKLMMK